MTPVLRWKTSTTIPVLPANGQHRVALTSLILKRAVQILKFEWVAPTTVIRLVQVDAWHGRARRQAQTLSEAVTYFGLSPQNRPPLERRLELQHGVKQYAHLPH